MERRSPLPAAGGHADPPLRKTYLGPRQDTLSIAQRHAPQQLAVRGCEPGQTRLRTRDRAVREAAGRPTRRAAAGSGGDAAMGGVRGLQEG